MSTDADTPSLYILYGSATGNSEQIAKDLSQKAEKEQQISSFFSCIVCEPLDRYKKYLDSWTTNNNKHALIIVCSTTGNGDAPENASRFVRFLKRKSTSPSTFQNIFFSVLALGDTNYDKFCNAGKTIDGKLSELGGMRVKALACADEATGLEDVVDVWTRTVLNDMYDAAVLGMTIRTDGTTTKTTRTTTTTTTTICADKSDEKEKEEATEDGPHQPAPVADSPTAPLVSTSTPPLTTATSSSTSPLCILYGSATGNAEHIAKNLAADYEKLIQTKASFFPSVICCEMDKWKKQCQHYWDQTPSSHSNKHGILIVTSTTGNGDAPENAGRFVRYLKRKSTADSMPFQHTAFAVLGLGDSNYDKFGETSRIVDKKLSELGGTRAKSLVVADEATGLEDVVEPWTLSVLDDITNACRGMDGTAESGSSTSTFTTLAVTTPKPTITTTSETHDEEKKMEVVDAPVVSPTPPPSTPSSSAPGVTIARALLKMNSSTPLPCVEHSCLPPLGTSLSSCAFIGEEEGDDEESSLERRRSSRGMSASLADIDRMTISTTSSTAIHYTMARPFHSKILNATYLTATSKDAAASVSDLLADIESDINDDLLVKAMDVYAEHFPLVPDEQVDASTCERNSKRVVEMTLALPDDFTLEYQPGDSLGLVVPNTPQAVRFVLDMLHEKHQVPPTQKISIDSNHPITVEEAVRTSIDLCSPMKSKRLLHSLSQFATNPEEEAVLRLLASKTTQGEELFCKFIDEQRMTVVDVLREFPSCQSIPLEGLFGILPGIPPRYYSVSSSPLDQRHGSLCLTVTFSVVDYVTPSLRLPDSSNQEFGCRRIGGVATRYLEVLCAPFLCQPHVIHHTDPTAPPHKIQSTIPIFPKPTKEFQLPASLSTPIILIGPGTGVAPFMGFLRHRQAQALQHQKVASTVVEGTWRGDFELQQDELPGEHASGVQAHNSTLGKCKLFFGCRYADHDWLYKDEMLAMEKEHKIELHTAFSRQPLPKQYVQDRMRGDQLDLADWIVQDKAYIYVCGDGNRMAKDVQQALVDILSEKVDDPKAYLEKLKEQNHFVMDIWTS
jgi:sulfite reductase alpha subunit-like flavoprotein